jgi:hypothetical protein
VVKFTTDALNKSNAPSQVSVSGIETEPAK